MKERGGHKIWSSGELMFGRLKPTQSGPYETATKNPIAAGGDRQITAESVEKGLSEKAAFRLLKNCSTLVLLRKNQDSSAF